MRTDTIDFIHRCVTCNESKSPRQLPSGLLHPCRPWSHLAIDFITDLPKSNGNPTIITVIDRFSKACRLIPLSKLPTAFETAESLCNFVFRFYGLPEDIEVLISHPEFGQLSSKKIISTSVSLQDIIRNRMARRNGSVRRSHNSSDPTANRTKQTGVDTSCGQSMLRNHFKNPQLD